MALSRSVLTSRSRVGDSQARRLAQGQEAMQENRLLEHINRSQRWEKRSKLREGRLIDSRI